MIGRTALKAEIELALTRFRVVELVGPRQSGKTTLARQFVPFDSINYFDLENPLHLVRLDQPMVALQDLRGLVVIDEVQRRPDLFPILPSMHSALTDLHLDHLFVVYPGPLRFPLADRVEAIPLCDIQAMSGKP